MNIFKIEREEEFKEFQVWFDPFLEELFSMETYDLNNHQNLKNQLLKEKVIFYTIQARSWTHSFEVFRKKHKHLKIAEVKNIISNHSTIADKVH